MTGAEADKAVQVPQLRFMYEGGIFGEWAVLSSEQSLFPNPRYRVAWAEYRVVGPDGQMISTGRQPRSKGPAKRATRVPNGKPS